RRLRRCCSFWSARCRQFGQLRDLNDLAVLDERLQTRLTRKADTRRDTARASARRLRVEAGWPKSAAGVSSAGWHRNYSSQALARASGVAHALPHRLDEDNKGPSMIQSQRLLYAASVAASALSAVLFALTVID